MVGAVSIMAFWLEVEASRLESLARTVFVTNTVRYVHCTRGTALGSSVIVALLCRTWRSNAHEDIGPPALDS